jgi:hypothetical protein
MTIDVYRIVRESRQTALKEASDLAAGGYTDIDLDAYGRGRLDACSAIRALLQAETDDYDAGRLASRQRL